MWPLGPPGSQSSFSVLRITRRTAAEETITGKSGVQAVSFGEIVFDRFEDSTRIGGAPLNFACFLQQFGVSVALVSAVGRDALGEVALQWMEDTGLDTTWVCSRERPTGTVDVRLADGDPEFDVAEGCAWEEIELLQDFGSARLRLLYFGTAARRTATNRATLSVLRSLNPLHLLFDVNLRPGLFSADVVLAGIEEATVLKMNEDEWRFIQRVTSHDSVAKLLESFGLEMVALTRGSRGAELYVRGRGMYVVEQRKVRVVDTVGAGDAFSAALAAGVMKCADPHHTLQIACEAGTAAAQHRGAHVELPHELQRAFD